MVAEPKDIKAKRKIKNKREYFRLNERLRIEVDYLKKPEVDELTGETIGEEVRQTTEHHTIDISAGGLQFFSRAPYRENTHVEITLFFRKTDPLFEPIKVKARVIRADQVEHSLDYTVCVEYADMDQRSRSHIERYIFVRQREMIAEKRIGFL